MTEKKSDPPLTLAGLVNYIGPIFEELKTDIRNVKTDIRNVKTDVRDVKIDLTSQIQVVKAEVHALDLKVDAKTTALEHKMDREFQKQTILIDDLKKMVKSSHKITDKHEKRLDTLELDIKLLKSSPKIS